MRIVASVVVAAIAIAGCGGTPGSTGRPPTAAAPTASAAPSPSPNGSPMAMREGPLAGGRYSFKPLTDAPSLTVVADVPNRWYGHPSWAVESPAGANGPTGLGIAFLQAEGLFSDPCHWDVDGSASEAQPGDVAVGPAVIDLVDALRANTSYTSSTPSPVTLGGYQGYELELQLAADMSTCDKDGDGEARYFVFSGPDAGLYAQGDGNIWHLYIVDVDGKRLITNVLAYEATPADVQQAAQSVIDSIEITP